ncbi:MAG: sulfotransferase [Candidatus Thermoplasmatota archaeon]
MNKNSSIKSKNISHPLFGISFRNWLKILLKNGGIDKEFFLRAFFITIASVSTIPIRVIYNLKNRPKLEKIEIKKPPIFIVGHWRSGTTYLHELFCEDPQLGHISFWQTLLPESFLLLEGSKNFLSKFLPSSRPMDNIEVDMDGPYEEEAGMAVLFPWSFFHCLHFPKNAEEQYLKSIHFSNLDDLDIEEWKKEYLHLIKGATYSNNGSRLVVKNPANTGRIKMLLNLFPNALFVHIYRNPYKVYRSTLRMRNRVLEKLALQKADKKEIKKQVIENYKRIMKKFFKEQNLIPEDQIVSVRYEDLVENPLGSMKKIYGKLGLKNFNEAKSYMETYLERKSDYKTNVYTFDKETIDTVDKNWGFTVKKWGYKPPQK